VRIISGEKKGFSVKAVPGMNTRPTTDKIRESMFQIIGPRFEGGTMLDLYGGSGVVGLEALSRGMDKVIFVDKNSSAVQTIKSNLKAAGWKERAEVYRKESYLALKAVSRKGTQFEMIFLDPPYEKHNLQKDLEFISEKQLLKTGGMVVVEHARQVILPETYKNMYMERRENYGITTISMYREGEAE